MDIYIKSFNRAYLLHRTIASIYHYLNGFNGRIVVLDDGTPQRYLDKITELFPNIEIVKSPYYEQKSNDISLNKVPEKVIPANFIVVVYDIHGKKVKDHKFTGGNTQQLRLNELSSGIYVLKVSSNQGLEKSFKLIKK